MKKILILLILISLLTAGCPTIGFYAANDFIMPDDMEFLALVEELDTPQKISEYMILNFTYEAHKFSSPDPYTLWKIRKGDCNDFATFGIFIANYHGYETFLIKIWSKFSKFIRHFIAVYVEDGTYSFTTNKNYYYDFKTFREIIIFERTLRDKDWLRYVVFDYEMNAVEKGFND